MKIPVNIAKSSLFIVTFLFTCLYFTNSIHASLLINEIFPSPLSGEEEWLEIYNSDSEAVDLSDWSIAKNFGLSTEKRHSLATLGSIAPLQFLSLVPNSSLVPLTNSGATIYLLHDGVVIDAVTYPSLSNKSYARVVDGADEWEITEPTRAASNNKSPVSSTPPNPSGSATYHHDFTATEIYSCSLTGEKEWLEVENLSSQTQDLTAWKLRSQSGVSRTLAVTTLPASGFAVLEFSSGLLNDSGGSVSLFDPNNELVWQLEFPACKTKGNSFIWQDETWLETNKVSQGRVNPVIDVSNNNNSTTSSNNNSNSTNSNTNSNSSSAVSSNDSVPPLTLSFKFPNYKLKRHSARLSASSPSNGQVLGASTSASKQSSASTIPVRFWLLIVGGILLVALPLVYYFIQKFKAADQSDDTY